MVDGLYLYGFRHSVYTRVVRMGLIETGLKATYVEVDPFADPPDPVLAQVTAFDHVPVLTREGFNLTETAAILRHLDRIGPAPSLVPADFSAAARMDQIIGIVDAYVYRPCVRKVFSHGFYRTLLGMDADPSLVVEGLSEAMPALRTLDQIAQEGLQLRTDDPSLADIHLAPMLACFTLVPQGAQALQSLPALLRWWDAMTFRPSLAATDPFAAS
jgi:glutathione S-transferase